MPPFYAAFSPPALDVPWAFRSAAFASYHRLPATAFSASAPPLPPPGWSVVHHSRFYLPTYRRLHYHYTHCLYGSGYHHLRGPCLLLGLLSMISPIIPAICIFYTMHVPHTDYLRCLSTAATCWRWIYRSFVPVGRLPYATYKFVPAHHCDAFYFYRRWWFGGGRAVSMPLGYTTKERVPLRCHCRFHCYLRGHFYTCSPVACHHLPTYTTVLLPPPPCRLRAAGGLLPPGRFLIAPDLMLDACLHICLVDLRAYRLRLLPSLLNSRLPPAALYLPPARSATTVAATVSARLSTTLLTATACPTFTTTTIALYTRCMPVDIPYGFTVSSPDMGFLPAAVLNSPFVTVNAVLRLYHTVTAPAPPPPAVG